MDLSVRTFVDFARGERAIDALAQAQNFVASSAMKNALAKTAKTIEEHRGQAGTAHVNTSASGAIFWSDRRWSLGSPDLVRDETTRPARASRRKSLAQQIRDLEARALEEPIPEYAPEDEPEFAWEKLELRYTLAKRALLPLRGDVVEHLAQLQDLGRMLSLLYLVDHVHALEAIRYPCPPTCIASATSFDAFRQGCAPDTDSLAWSCIGSSSLEILDMLRLRRSDRVLELFTGRGNLNLFLSLGAPKELVSVERDPLLGSTERHHNLVNWLDGAAPELRPRVTTPIFLVGELVEFSFPPAYFSKVVLDPPYGRGQPVEGTELEALLGLAQTFTMARSLLSPGGDVVLHLPTDWVDLCVALACERHATADAVKEAVEHVLLQSPYYEGRVERAALLRHAIRELPPARWTTLLDLATSFSHATTRRMDDPIEVDITLARITRPG